MGFQLIGEISDVELIAEGRGIRERNRLWRTYGRARWKKKKGHARIRLPTGEIVRAEIHWYEAQGLGRREMKIKKLMEEEA